MPIVLFVVLAAAKATVQGVRITNWPTPTPTAIPTEKPFTLPLAIPGVDVAWATFWLTAFGVTVAIIAAAYAFKAFKAAEADLDISKRNFAIAARTPQLEASFSLIAEARMVDIGSGTIAQQWLAESIDVTITNGATGERRCDAFFFEMFLPSDALSTAYFSQLLVNGPIGAEFRLESVVSDRVLFPSGSAAPLKFNVPMRHLSEPREIAVKYRIKDDYNTYPSTGYLTTLLTIPPWDRHAFFAPRDDAEQAMWGTAKGRIERIEQARRAYSVAFERLEDEGRIAVLLRIERGRQIIDDVINDSRLWS